MKRGIAVIHAFLVFIFLVVNSPVEAKQTSGDFLLSPYAGGYAFDADQEIKSGLVLGLRLGLALTPRWGIETGIGTVSTKRELDTRDIHATLFDLSVLYHFKPSSRWDPFVTAGAGTINVGLRGSNPMAHYGIGINYMLVEERVSFRTEVRNLFDFNEQMTLSNLEATIGLTFRAPKIIPLPPPLIDSDHDNVPDIQDQCASTPPGISVDENGCPLDADLDKVPNTLDKCPNTPVGISVDKSGCPLDDDSDNVPDTLDKCPSTPAGISVDKDGCPLDADLDGIPDTIDLCPGTTVGEKIDASGCSKKIEEKIEDKPVNQDGDHDGVSDALDQCLNSPNGAVVNAVGCPIPSIPPLKDKTNIRLDIQFDPSQSVIKPQYEEMIKTIAEMIISNPEMTFTINGYTDNTGTKKRNRILSQLRAEALMQYLVDHFTIQLSRLKAKGFGTLNPIADNKTAIGREKNRRIEIVAEIPKPKKVPKKAPKQQVIKN